MSVHDQLDALVPVALAMVFAGIIGIDREWRQQSAGLRTHMLVGLGAALIASMAELSYPMDTAGRLTASVISGVGFLGAGVIIQRRDQVHGLTTAASVWLVAMIGIVTGMRLYVLAGGTAVLGWFVLTLLRVMTKGGQPPHPATQETQDE